MPASEPTLRSQPQGEPRCPLGEPRYPQLTDKEPGEQDRNQALGKEVFEKPWKLTPLRSSAPAQLLRNHGRTGHSSACNSELGTQGLQNRGRRAHSPRTLQHPRVCSATNSTKCLECLHYVNSHSVNVRIWGETDLVSFQGSSQGSFLSTPSFSRWFQRSWV